MDDITLTIDVSKFKQAYVKAKTENKGTFMYQGHEILVSYAKYVIEGIERGIISKWFI